MATIKKVQVEASMGDGFTIESRIRKHSLFVDHTEIRDRSLR